MPLKPLLTLLLATYISGCVSMATDQLASNLSNAMLNQSDPEIVRSGAPAYLLLIDSLIEGDPTDRGLLYAGAKLYGSYAGGLVSDPARKQRLTDKALDYAARGLCQETEKLCQSFKQPFEVFAASLETVDSDEIEGIYLYATSWAGWIEAHSDDWNAIADLPKAKAMLAWVVDLEPAYEQGRAQLYLGVINSQVPPSLGGKPEIGRSHFESAMNYSNERDLIVKVEYARHYARLIFDQALHDRLLNEVISADPISPGLTLTNIIAQQQAEELLRDDYF
jgi:hypothetical protein